MKKTLTVLAFSIAAFNQSAIAQSNKNPLTFDPKNFTTLHITVDGAPMEVRRYHVVYVAKPIAMAEVQPPRGPTPGAVGPNAGAAGMGPGGPGQDRPGQGGMAPGAGPGPDIGFGRAPAGPFDPYAYQSMYIYVPQRAYEDPRAAIILQVSNGGWFASPAQDRVQDGGKFSATNDTDNTGAALKAGYVVINAGTRSRGIKAADGSWAGKSPAVIVDAKAVVRYLRLNDALMPGSAERVIITGTSGGGALSVAVAASGNSPDYYPYLAEIGAAGMDASGRSTIRDDVFATVAYCPITDLGHADMAYEWQYNSVRTAANTLRGQYPADMQQASKTLAAAYPAYLSSLKLKREDGKPLGAASLREAILAQVKKGVEAAIARGEKMPAIGEDLVFRMRNQDFHLRNEWLTVKDGKVVNIDYEKYLQFVTAGSPLKTAPAFDASANTGNKGVSGENTLFGDAKLDYSNFAEFSWNHNEVKGDGSGADDTGSDWAAYVKGAAGRALQQQIRMASPMAYLNSAADSAPYWYFRHGMADRDTSFAVETVLYYAVRGDASVKDVNFKLAWMQGHAGNYDVQEAYAWVASVLARAGDPLSTVKK